MRQADRNKVHAPLKVRVRDPWHEVTLGYDQMERSGFRVREKFARGIHELRVLWPITRIPQIYSAGRGRGLGTSNVAATEHNTDHHRGQFQKSWSPIHTSALR